LGVSRDQAAENRRAIVAAATQLFRERGVGAIGLTELMKHAGFTQGGFYNHFESKAALVAERPSDASPENRHHLPGDEDGGAGIIPKHRALIAIAIANNVRLGAH
jgi:TetR/AcrR family transcriptional repressor of nem operon